MSQSLSHDANSEDSVQSRDRKESYLKNSRVQTIQVFVTCEARGQLSSTAEVASKEQSRNIFPDVPRLLVTFASVLRNARLNKKEEKGEGLLSLHTNLRRDFLCLEGVVAAHYGLFLVEDAFDEVLVFLIVSPNPCTGLSQCP